MHKPLAKTSLASACTFEGCGLPVKMAGLCSIHHSRRSRGRDMRAPIRAVDPKECLVSWCDRTAVATGMCSGHWQRSKKGRDLDVPFRHRNAGQNCSFDGCDRRAQARGLCGTHSRQKRKGASLTPIRDITPGAWRKKLSPEGYVVIFRTPVKGGERRADGRGVKQEVMLEHRFVMEQQLGRKLLPDETVHHINGVRNDNRPENLELWSSSHPKGQRVEDKVEWALEMLGRYAPDRVAPR